MTWNADVHSIAETKRLLETIANSWMKIDSY